MERTPQFPGCFTNSSHEPLESDRLRWHTCRLWLRAAAAILTVTLAPQAFIRRQREGRLSGCCLFLISQLAASPISRNRPTPSMPPDRATWIFMHAISTFLPYAVGLVMLGPLGHRRSMDPCRWPSHLSVGARGCCGRRLRRKPRPPTRLARWLARVIKRHSLGS